MDILMKIRSRLHFNAPLLLFLISLVDFLVYYIINMWFWEYNGAVYSAYFIGRLTEFMLPIIAAALILCKERSLPKALLTSLIFSLTRLVYLIPYYYLRYVFDIYDSIEAIGIAIPLSLLVSLILALKIFLFYIIIWLFIRRSGKDRESLFPLGIFDLDNPAVFGILISTLVAFLIEVGFEIYDTVTFFIGIGTRYKLGEVLFIVGTYVFLIAALVITNILAVFFTTRIKKILTKAKEKYKFLNKDAEQISDAQNSEQI